MKLLHDTLYSLSGWQATAALLLFYAAALAAATFIEAGLSAEAARAAIYHAWWMYLLYLLLIVNFVLVAARARLWQRRRWGTLLLHSGFIVMIVGALITHVWGYEGTMHLREGETADRITVSHTDRRALPFSITLRAFNLHRYPGSHTPSSYESEVTIDRGGETRDERIYMNHIARVDGFRIYQSSYDPDEQGSILSINYDPVGTPVTYAGYFLLIAGMGAAVAQPGSRLRTLLGRLNDKKRARA